jgi:hypothetical protein
MSIRKQARYELARSNFGESGTKAMMQILDIFFEEFDSGGATFCAAPVLQKLIAGKPLSPLTGQDDEWFDVSSASGGNPMWQNIRCSTVFRDGSGSLLRYRYSGTPYNHVSIRSRKY